MSGFLGILLKILLAALGLVFVAVAGFVWRYRIELRALLGGGAPTPSRITLEPIARPSWARKRKARDDLEAFVAAGFVEAGDFRIPEMPGVEILSLVHPAERAYAVVYRHAAAGVWSDVVTLFEDGTGLTVTGAPFGGELDRPPWSRQVWEAGASAERLLELHEEGARAEGRKEASAERFGHDFTEAYARIMAWRTKRGGLTREEVVRVADAMGRALEEGEAAAVLGEERRQTFERLREECVAVFVALPESEGYARDRVERFGAFVVHDLMTPEEAWIELTVCADVPEEMWDDADAAIADGQPPRRLFAEMAARLPVRARPMHVGSVEEPVAADVWLSPEAQEG